MRENSGRFFLAALICWLAHVAGAQVPGNTVQVISGEQLSTDSYVSLGGDWEFYWNQLLDPTDFNSPRSGEKIKVPGAWNRTLNYPAVGYATYRHTVQLPAERESLLLYFNIINSAAKVWVNGKLITETGVVSSEKKTFKAKLQETIVPLPDNESRIELVIQVANFNYFSGGLVGTPQLAKPAFIFKRASTNKGIENFFAGSLIALFIYQIILYLLFHRGKPYLWLALICLGVALRALIVHGGSFLLPNLFPFVDWEIWKKIEFGSVYAISALFPLYVADLFEDFAPRKWIKVFVGIAGLLCVAVLLTPQYIYGQLLDVCHFMLLLAFIYAVYSIGKAWRGGNRDARIILFGVLASFPFIVTEIVKNSLLLKFHFNSLYLVELGVLVFLLFQVYLLANHYANSFHNLEVLNRNLERMIDERTGELVKANTVKDRLLSVISHDIKSPLNSLQGILNIYNKGALSKNEFDQFSRQIEGDLGKTSLLVENILYWTAAQLKGIRIKHEKINVVQLVEENFQLLGTIAANKKITFTSAPANEFVVDFDRNILTMAIRNLLSNAIKFSFEGGAIDVHMVKTSVNEIRIIDHGVGMNESTLRTLADPQQTISTSGTTAEKGTGLGLALCRDYLEKAGGSLSIASEEGKGSVFTIVLPISQ